MHFYNLLIDIFVGIYLQRKLQQQENDITGRILSTTVVDTMIKQGSYKICATSLMAVPDPVQLVRCTSNNYRL